MTQATKNQHKRPYHISEIGHLEGKYFCNCKYRNWRRWVGLKLGNHKLKEKQDATKKGFIEESNL